VQRGVEVALYYLSCIVHLLAKNGAENHLDVLDEGVVTVVVRVKVHLIRIGCRL